MHNEAMEWLNDHAATDESVTVLDIGGRDINGSARALFPGASVYIVLDIMDGSNVDIVADAAIWVPDREYDIVICAEVFEHTQVWPHICNTAYKACRPGGQFIATMAGPGRAAHSAIDGGWTLHPGEYYRNVQPNDLQNMLVSCGWTDVHVDQKFNPSDVRATARKASE